MATPYIRRPRASPYRDPMMSGAYTWLRRQDETDTYSLDIAGLLDSGETCSSIALADTSGPTISSPAVTSAGVLSMTVSSGSGTTTARVTTNTARIIEIPLQWRLTEQLRGGEDYS